MSKHQGRVRPEVEEDDTRSSPPYDRYGMVNEDWRHMDEYWRDMYGDEYPRENERNRRRTMTSYVGRDPGDYERSDERIRNEINEQLTRHHMIDATSIEVSVQDGEVILRGTIDSGQTKRLAEDVAESVSGVEELRNELRVQPHWYTKGGRAA